MPFIPDNHNLRSRYNQLVAQENTLVKQIEDVENQGKDPRPFFSTLKEITSKRVKVFKQLNSIQGGL